MSNILFKCAHEITIQTPLCLMAKWAKELCVGLSCQINISIPLSAALSMFDDVTPPGVRLWGGNAFSQLQQALWNNSYCIKVWRGLLRNDGLLCINKCIKDFECPTIVLDFHVLSFNNDRQWTVIGIHWPLWVSMFFSCAAIKRQLVQKHGNNVHTGAQGQNRMTAIRPQPL